MKKEKKEIESKRISQKNVKDQVKGPRREWEGKGGAFVVVLVKY